MKPRPCPWFIACYKQPSLLSVQPRVLIYNLPTISINTRVLIEYFLGHSNKYTCLCVCYPSNKNVLTSTTIQHHRTKRFYSQKLYSSDLISFSFPRHYFKYSSDFLMPQIKCISYTCTSIFKIYTNFINIYNMITYGILDRVGNLHDSSLYTI